MRIVSLLPSATEIVCALGLGDELVGVTHECDWPPEVVGKPVMTSSVFDHGSSSSADIHRLLSDPGPRRLSPVPPPRPPPGGPPAGPLPDPEPWPGWPPHS